MRALLVALAALAAGVPPASAFSDLDRMKLADDLGQVLAAEEACGLAYDQDAITAWVEKNVPADDMSWPGTLSTMTAGASYALADMSASARTAHCAQIRRIARSYGFVR
jgi:hypothetical protein